MGSRGDGIHSITEIIDTGCTGADGTIECGTGLARGNQGPGCGITDRGIRSGVVNSVAALEVAFDGRVDIAQCLGGADTLQAVLITKLIDGEGTVGGTADREVVAIVSSLTHGEVADTTR